MFSIAIDSVGASIATKPYPTTAPNDMLACRSCNRLPTLFRALLLRRNCIRHVCDSRVDAAFIVLQQLRADTIGIRGFLLPQLHHDIWDFHVVTTRLVINGALEYQIALVIRDLGLADLLVQFAESGTNVSGQNFTMSAQGGT